MRGWTSRATASCARPSASRAPWSARSPSRRHRLPSAAVSPRVAIGGIAIESSTFSPHRSRAADFTVVRGSALLAKYDALPSTVDWIPLVHARALPGGAVERAFYDSIKTELLEGLRMSLPLDGVYLDIHGAMTVVGMIDAEGDLAAAIREVVGR